MNATSPATKPNPKPYEPWLVHDEAGNILAAGHGPVGLGAKQKIAASGTLVTGLHALPNLHRVVMVAGKPTVQPLS